MTLRIIGAKMQHTEITCEIPGNSGYILFTSPEYKTYKINKFISLLIYKWTVGIIGAKMQQTEITREKPGSSVYILFTSPEYKT